MARASAVHARSSLARRLPSRRAPAARSAAHASSSSRAARHLASGSGGKHAADARRRSVASMPVMHVSVAMACAASTKTTSFSSVSACSGVFETSRRATQDSPVGASKVVAHRERRGAFRERVEAAAIAVLARARLPVELAVGDLRGHARGLRRIHARAAHFRREQPAACNAAVADHLRLEPDARPAGEQQVLADPLASNSGVTRDDCW